jgi:hypothetical protein
VRDSAGCRIRVEYSADELAVITVNSVKYKIQVVMAGANLAQFRDDLDAACAAMEIEAAALRARYAVAS